VPTEPHDTQLYALGKGIVYIATWSSDAGPTDPTDYADLGNCTSFEVTPAVDKLDHFSSRGGARFKDKTVVIEKRYTITFDLDELAAANLNRFFLGTQALGVISAFENPDSEYAVKFVSDNPAGKNFTFRFWKVTLTPNGSLQLITDEWMSMSFTGEGLSDTVNHSSSPLFTVTYTTTSTTSSSTSTTSSSTTTTAP